MSRSVRGTVVAVLGVLVLASCGAPAADGPARSTSAGDPAVSEPAGTASPAPDPPGTEQVEEHVIVEWQMYGSLEEAASLASFAVIASRPTQVTTECDCTVMPSSTPGTGATGTFYSFYEFVVDKNIAGEDGPAAGDSIVVGVYGGTYEDREQVNDGGPRFAGDGTYLLLLAPFWGRPDRFAPVGGPQGAYRIVDGKLRSTGSPEIPGVAGSDVESVESSLVAHLK